VDSFNAGYLTAKDDVGLEVALLGRIFRRISHCERVHVKEEQTGGALQFHDVPRFISRDFALEPADISTGDSWPRRSSSTTTRLQAVLLAIFGTRRVIHTLQSTNLTWTNLFKRSGERGGASKQLTAFSTLMPYLKNLELIFDGSATSVSPDRLKQLSYLLHSATNLQWLRIRLHGTPLTSEHEIFQYEFSSDAPLLLGSTGKHMFKQLQSLSLDSYVTYEHELIRLVRAHSSNLRNLELRNILLLRQGTDSPRGCWVRVIKAFRNILKLQTMTFGGCLSNGGLQLWYINEPPDGPNQSSCLRTRIEHFITHKSTVCPPELLSVGIDPGKEDLDSPTDKHPWVKGDCSWSMTQRVGHPDAPMGFIDDEVDNEEVIYLDTQSPTEGDLVYPPSQGQSHVVPNYPPPQVHILPSGGSSYFAVQVAQMPHSPQFMNFNSHTMSQQHSGSQAAGDLDDEVEEEFDKVWSIIE
jgi:hypothetical protein